MVRLDSIKIKTPLQAAKSIDYNRLLNTTSSTADGIVLSDVWSTNKTKKVDVGINRIEVNKHNETILFNVSAKALKTAYIDGINKNTIDILINQINSTGIVKLNSEKFIYGSDVLTCDITDNIILNDAEIYNKLQKIPLPNKYEITAYNTAKNVGIVFKGKQKSFKERQIIYNKYIELMHSSSNKDFRAIVPQKTIENFKNIVRVEGNLTDFDKIRHYTESTDNKLSSILQSEAKVNYSLFNKITASATPETIKLFSEYDGMKWNEIVKIEGYKGIFSTCNFEWKLIEQFIKVHNRNNYRHVIPTIKQHYNSMLPKDETTGQNIIELFRDLLRKAA